MYDKKVILKYFGRFARKNQEKLNNLGSFVCGSIQEYKDEYVYRCYGVSLKQSVYLFVINLVNLL